MIRVVLPAPLRALAQVEGEVLIAPAQPPTLSAVLDALEVRHPVLCGTIREHGSGRRRRLIRFFVCGEDWSHEDAARRLPEAVTSGREALLIVGAIAGG